MGEIDDVLEVLRAYNIEPDADPTSPMREIGKTSPNETIYATSLDAVDKDTLDADESGPDPRMEEWWGMLTQILERSRTVFPWTEFGEAPEPACAWYCPIHYFGYGWGIYIREQCILSLALDIAKHLDLAALEALKLSSAQIQKHLLRAAFYMLFLHEQFHHKAESLGFRLLVATGTDRYRRYKTEVYRATYLTPDCLEESLANAESYLRIKEDRYKLKLSVPFTRAYQKAAVASFELQPAGYREAKNFLTDAKFKAGQDKFQSAMLDGQYPPTTPTRRWAVAPQMIRSLMNIKADIYVVVPIGVKPLFTTTLIDPGVTISTARATKALVNKYGYSIVSGGGNGSHVKLEKPGVKPITLKGNQSALSPGLLKHVLSHLGDYPLSQAREVL